MRIPCCLCLPVRLCIPLNFFVSYAVLVVSKETRRLVLPKFLVTLLFHCCFGLFVSGETLAVCVWKVWGLLGLRSDTDLFLLLNKEPTGPGLTIWQTNGTRFSTAAGIFLFSLRRQDNSGAHPISYAVDDGTLSLGIKRKGREAEQSSPTSAQFKNTRSCISIHPYVSMAWCLIKQRTSSLRGMWRALESEWNHLKSCCMLWRRVQLPVQPFGLRCNGFQ
jgi:hypothetical protein